jgi:hypothetical protein
MRRTRTKMGQRNAHRRKGNKLMKGIKERKVIRV